MKKTYYIFEHVDRNGDTYWQAHGRGILSKFKIFNIWNGILDTTSYRSADHCEKKLHRALHPTKPKWVKTITFYKTWKIQEERR